MFSNVKEPPETSEIAACLESRASSLFSWTVAVLGSGHLATWPWHWVSTAFPLDRGPLTEVWGHYAMILPKQTLKLGERLRCILWPNGRTAKKRDAPSWKGHTQISIGIPRVPMELASHQWTGHLNFPVCKKQKKPFSFLALKLQI